MTLWSDSSTETFTLFHSFVSVPQVLCFCNTVNNLLACSTDMLAGFLSANILEKSISGEFFMSARHSVCSIVIDANYFPCWMLRVSATSAIERGFGKVDFPAACVWSGILPSEGRRQP